MGHTFSPCMIRMELVRRKDGTRVYTENGFKSEIQAQGIDT